MATAKSSRTIDIIRVVSFFLVIFALAPLAVYADLTNCTVVTTGAAEVVSFATKTNDGHRVPINAVLMKPDGKGPFPAMVILHGGGGVRPPRCYGRPFRKFVELGYVSLLIDSMSVQRPYRAGLGGYNWEDQAQDAHIGREFLTTLPYVDSERIGVVGWSSGGAAVLDAVSSTKKTFPMEKKAPFRAAAAVYPVCFRQLDDLDAPLLVLIGEKDTEVSAAGKQLYPIPPPVELKNDSRSFFHC